VEITIGVIVLVSIYMLGAGTEDAPERPSGASGGS